MPREAVLIGATGLVGGMLLDHLLADPGIDAVTVLARRPIGTDHPKLRVIELDFRQMAKESGLFAATEAFCTLGTTRAKAGSAGAFEEVDRHFVREFAKVAQAEGATRFLLVSSVGADAQAANLYLRVKGTVEAEIDALGFAGFDIFRPSLLLGPRLERRPAEAMAQLAAPFLNLGLIGPLQRYRAIPAERVARAMARCAQQPPAGRRVHETASILELARLPG